MSVMSQCYSVVIDQGISEPGHGREMSDVLNAIYKRYIYQLINNVQLPGSKTSDSQVPINSCTENNDVSLPK